MDRPVPFLAIRQESRRPAFPWVSCVANATKKEHGITSTIVFTDEARAGALCGSCQFGRVRAACSPDRARGTRARLLKWFDRRHLTPSTSNPSYQPLGFLPPHGNQPHLSVKVDGSSRLRNRTRDFELTPRERDLVRGIIEGRTNREMARELGLTEQSVRNVLSIVYQKAHVRNRLELALFAVRHRLELEK
jgi:DNA-binding CsgD family transcriptional regulator